MTGSRARVKALRNIGAGSPPFLQGFFAPIHLAVTSPLPKRPISKVAASLHWEGAPSLSQTMTRQKAVERERRDFPA